MIGKTLHKRNVNRLPKLAMTALVFWGLSTNTQLDAATPWTIQPVTRNGMPANIQQLPRSSENETQKLPHGQILSAADAELYRTAFMAQERGDWTAADAALAAIKDRRLIGHVQADRLSRRAAELSEIKAWLEANADLPQAQTLYNRARRMPGFAAAKIAQPHTPNIWVGDDGHEAPSGFKTSFEAANDGPNRLASKTNALLRKGDAITAREVLATELLRGTVPVADAAQIEAKIAASFFYYGQIERARPLAHQAAEHDVPLGNWIDGLSSWKQQDYTSAYKAFADLARKTDLSAWDRSSAAYWAYRAARRLNDEKMANYWLATAANNPRTFYGHMAASLMGRKDERLWKVPEFTAKHAALLEQHPAGTRALALIQAGRADLAETELRTLSFGGRRDLQAAALALADKAHMPSLSLQLGGSVHNEKGQIYEAALYPIPAWQPEGGFKVDRALIYALIKHESQFDVGSVSNSGACGLMQIMPATLRHMAFSAAAATRGCPEQAFTPATNIALGQKYVRELAGQPKIGNNLLLLLAAYNGGPGNVSRWIDGDSLKDPLLFLESLPMRETRNYVQQVLLHYWMYRSRLDEPEASVQQLAQGQWPRYASNDNALPAALRSAIILAAANE